MAQPEAVQHRPHAGFELDRGRGVVEPPAHEGLRDRRVHRHLGQPVADLDLLLIELVAQLGAPRVERPPPGG